jgi:hypothetical protein
MTDGGVATARFPAVEGPPAALRRLFQPTIVEQLAQDAEAEARSGGGRRGIQLAARGGAAFACSAPRTPRVSRRLGRPWRPTAPWPSHPHASRRPACRWPPPAPVSRRAPGAHFSLARSHVVPPALESNPQHRRWSSRCCQGAKSGALPPRRTKRVPRCPATPSPYPLPLGEGEGVRAGRPVRAPVGLAASGCPCHPTRRPRRQAVSGRDLRASYSFSPKTWALKRRSSARGLL